MAFHRYSQNLFSLICDSCGEEMDFSSKQEIRDFLDDDSNGWIKVGINQMYCDSCRKYALKELNTFHKYGERDRYYSSRENLISAYKELRDGRTQEDYDAEYDQYIESQHPNWDLKGDY